MTSEHANPQAMHDLGLTEKDSMQEEQVAREIRLKAEVTRRSIVFAGSSLDTEGPKFIMEFEQFSDVAIAESDEWFTQSRIARLIEQPESGKPQFRSSGGGRGKSGIWRNQPSDAVRTAMDMASEWLVWKLPFRRRPKEMSDEC